MNRALTTRQAAHLAALCAIVDTALGNTVQRVGIYSDGCRNGWQPYVDSIPNSYCCEISDCFRAELLSTSDVLCLECEPSEKHFGSRQIVQTFVLKTLDLLKKNAKTHIATLAECIFINHSAEGQQVRELVVNIEPIDLSALRTEGPMSQSFCGDVPTTLAKASLATARWTILASSLGLYPTEARMYQNSGKTGYAGFVAVTPNSNHCELVECLRHSLNRPSCDESTELEEYFGFQNDIRIARQARCKTQKLLNDTTVQFAMQQVARVLARNKSITGDHLQELISDLPSIDLDSFLSEIMAKNTKLRADRG
ncbi:hypothetical protein L1889_00610 [Paenalcaligenes niemegkensis]|uniref:hypothetical protein n=1 Tax=Paenalcaligenes niemegkensis TaxID=2895469 RepID=UPI001EE9756A|nr:hypothetical protein [Paenalcaligenes niemegkensis]MCQ9615405.1 hypothetical protein [Paenalcaligenes niemegkensis]